MRGVQGRRGWKVRRFKSESSPSPRFSPVSRQKRKEEDWLALKLGEGERNGCLRTGLRLGDEFSEVSLGDARFFFCSLFLSFLSFFVCF